MQTHLYQSEDYDGGVMPLSGLPHPVKKTHLDVLLNSERNPHQSSLIQIH